MVACHPPSLSTPEEIKRELLECRTFAYSSVMEAAHKYILKLEKRLAHPPGDSIEKAIGELEEKLPHVVWWIRTWSPGLKYRCQIIVMVGERYEAEGPTPLSALRAALSRIPMKEEG